MSRLNYFRGENVIMADQLAGYWYCKITDPTLVIISCWNTLVHKILDDYKGLSTFF